MELLKGLELIGLSILVRKCRTLIISDVHIGFEDEMQKNGILVPRHSSSSLCKRARELSENVEFNTLVINGDLKHSFGNASNAEWREALRFLSVFKGKKLVLVRGNHDTALQPIASRMGITVTDYYSIGGFVFAHGDKLLNRRLLGKKTLIIGHEHPAIAISTPQRSETYKCYLLGTTPDRKNPLIVMPSLSELLIGSNILAGDRLSPYLNQDLGRFRVIVHCEALYDFGRVRDIKGLSSLA